MAESQAPVNRKRFAVPALWSRASHHVPTANPDKDSIQFKIQEEEIRRLRNCLQNAYESLWNYTENIMQYTERLMAETVKAHQEANSEKVLMLEVQLEAKGVQRGSKKNATSSRR